MRIAGRYFATSTKLRHAFRLPATLDVARRAPSMHDSVLTSDAAIETYCTEGINRPSRSEPIKPLGLTGPEKQDLIALLKSLNSDPVLFPIRPDPN